MCVERKLEIQLMGKLEMGNNTGKLEMGNKAGKLEMGNKKQKIHSSLEKFLVLKAH